MAIDYSKYPPNWLAEIRPRILKRAGNCCEYCGVQNHAIGYRNREGLFIAVQKVLGVKEGKLYLKTADRIIKIVLTISHRNHDPENWAVQDKDLAALCQKCHFAYDAKWHSHTRAINKNCGTLQLFG